MYYDANINTNLEKTNLFYWQRICSDFYYNYTKNKQTRIMKKTILTLLCVLALVAGAAAQDDDDLGLEFEKESGSGVSLYGGFDVASAYAWRGNLLVSGANFQPNIEFDAGPFAIGAWNCTDFHGDYKELDLYTSITAGQVTFTFTDYYTPEDASAKYGNYKNDETSHTFEFSVDWASEFGLDASMNVLLYGADKKYWLEDDDPDEATKNAFGTYFEIGYTGSIKDVDFRPCVGMVFNQSTWYGDGTGTHKGVNVVNIGVKASKEIKITEHFSLPVYACFGYNPQANDVAALAGFTIGF